MHSIQALIAPEEIFAGAKLILPSAVVCPLSQGLVLLPITDEVEMEFVASGLASSDPSPPLAKEMVPGVAALGARLSIHGSVVYAATFIFGGTGSQDALTWHGGELVLSLSDDEDSMSAWPNSPISRALRHIGVKAATGEDEFDAIGLGRYRSNEAWVKAFAAA